MSTTRNVEQQQGGVPDAPLVATVSTVATEDELKEALCTNAVTQFCDN